MTLIDPSLAAVLVCPVDQGDLSQDVVGSRLVCEVCARSYPVEGGVPVMLIEEAEGGPS